MGMITILLLLILAYVISYFVKSYQNIQRLQKLGYTVISKPYPIIGNLFHFKQILQKLETEEGAYALLDIYVEKDKTFGFYLGSSPAIISNDIEFIREVFIKQFSNFTSRAEYTFQDTYPTQESLLHIGKHGPNGYGWKELRTITSQLFTTAKIRQVFQSTKDEIEFKIFPNICERTQALMAKLIEKSNKNGNLVDIYPNFQALTLDIMGKNVLGIETDTLNNRDAAIYNIPQEFLHELTFDRSWALGVSLMFPEIGRVLRKISVVGRIEKKLIKLLELIVESKIESFDPLIENKNCDLINLFLNFNSRNNNMIKKESIVSSVFGIFMAGYETSSTSLAYTAYLLAKDQNVQEKLYNEILSVSNNAPNLDFESILKMPYLNAVYMESLRLKPPSIFFTSRQCVKETVINGKQIPAGTFIIIPNTGINWFEQYWSDPHNFNPERFFGSKFDPLKWFPFGAGPRNCIGMRMAEIIIKTAIFELIKTFRLEFHEKTQDPIKVNVSNFVVHPKGGILLKLVQRE